MKRLAAIVVLLTLLPAAFASAQESSAAAVKPMSIWPNSGLRDGGRQYVMRGQRVRIAGSVRPFVARQRVTVEISRRGKTTTVTAPVRDAKRRGHFFVVFTARRSGRYTVRARHDATPEQAALAAETLAVHSIRPRARHGSSGRDVRLLQRGLARLGYLTPHGGSYNAGTARAVLAFRKVNGMSRKLSAGRAVLSKLFRGAGGFALRYPRAGKHVEFDWSRQVLVLARGGRAERIYHASSGTMVTPTVFGTYSFYRTQPGTNAKGMVHSNYFIRGYAIHGYASVPNYPASHGCIRVPIPNALSISRWIELGDRISVYR